MAHMPMPTYNIQISDGIMVKGNQVYIDGKPLPSAPGKGHNTTIINNKVFIDGYEFKKGKWRRTLRALWHLWF
jgi:hypothetical protein